MECQINAIRPQFSCVFKTWTFNALSETYSNSRWYHSWQNFEAYSPFQLEDPLVGGDLCKDCALDTLRPTIFNDIMRDSWASLESHEPHATTIHWEKRSWRTTQVKAYLISQMTVEIISDKSATLTISAILLFPRKEETLMVLSCRCRLNWHVNTRKWIKTFPRANLEFVGINENH